MPNIRVCYKCEYRHIGCHGTCIRYFGELEYCRWKNSQNNKAKEADSFIMERSAKASSRYYKSTGKSIKLKGWQ